MAHFTYRQKVLFQHCDPAGIVFYPRYFEMINLVVEEWFDEGLGVPFSELHMKRRSAIPTACINTVFKAPSHLGDCLIMVLIIQKLGGASLDLKITAEERGQVRFETTLTLVHVDIETTKPSPWPQDIRNRFEILMEETS
ncbi:MAG: thioesterase family protein [Sneathiella sp.]